MFFIKLSVFNLPFRGVGQKYPPSVIISTSKSVMHRKASSILTVDLFMDYI